jgi:hypothetical protein
MEIVLCEGRGVDPVFMISGCEPSGCLSGQGTRTVLGANAGRRQSPGAMASWCPRRSPPIPSSR